MSTRHVLVAAVLFVVVFSFLLPFGTYLTGFAILAESGQAGAASGSEWQPIGVFEVLPTGAASSVEQELQLAVVPGLTEQVESLLAEVEQGVEQAQGRWLEVPETRRALRLAHSAYGRQEYDVALTRAKDAQLLLIAETKGRVSMRWLVKRYWWLALIVMIGLMFSSLWTALRLELFLVYRRLRVVDRQEKGLLRRLRTLQIKHYQEKKLSQASFVKQSQVLQLQLVKLRQERVTLRHKRMGILVHEQEAKNLLEEYDDISEQLRELQQKYFLNGSLPHWEFRELHSVYKTRLAEIEEQTALLNRRLSSPRGRSGTVLLSVVDYFYSRPVGLTVALVLLAVVGLGVYVSPTFSFTGSVVLEQPVTLEAASQQVELARQGLDELAALGVGVVPLESKVVEAEALLRGAAVAGVDGAQGQEDLAVRQEISRVYSLSKEVLLAEEDILIMAGDIAQGHDEVKESGNAVAHSLLHDAEASLSVGEYDLAREQFERSRELSDAGRIEQVRQESLSGLGASVLGAWVVQVGGVLVVMGAGCVPVGLWLFAQRRRGSLSVRDEVKVLGRLNRQAQEDYFVRKKIGRDTFVQRRERYQRKVDEAGVSGLPGK